MATVQDVLSVARAEIGYIETGGANNNSGNITKYWAELYPAGQGEPWCACFQRWVDIHAKAPDLPVSNPYYCPTLVTYAKQHGLWDESGHYEAGDMVFFDWSGQGVAEHIGRVESDDGTTIVTVEGNTSAENVTGSQTDGGGVHERHRPHGNTVMGVLKYSRLLAHTAANGGLPPRNPVKANPYAPYAAFCKQGSTGNAVKFVQWAVGVPVDGDFGPQTNHAVRLFQQYHHLTVDGIVGPQTISALRSVTH